MDEKREVYLPNKKLALNEFLGMEPTGSKEDLPKTLRLPSNVVSIVRQFVLDKPYGEIGGRFRYNPFIKTFELHDKVEGETLDPDRNPKSVRSLKLWEIPKDILKRAVSAEYDIELHTHPDYDNNAFDMTSGGVTIPKTYYEVWSSFPSSTDLYNYVAKPGSLIDAVISASSNGATILVPFGKDIPSRAILYIGPRLKPIYKRGLEPIGRGMLQAIEKYGNNEKGLAQYFQTEFKQSVRQAIANIGNTFNFAPYFADNFSEEFVKG